MLSASSKIICLEVLQLASSVSSIAGFGYYSLKKDVSKRLIATGCAWMCAAFIFYVNSLVVTVLYIPDYRLVLYYCSALIRR